jgi:hypothetical protein
MMLNCLVFVERRGISVGIVDFRLAGLTISKKLSRSRRKITSCASFVVCQSQSWQDVGTTISHQGSHVRTRTTYI